MSTRSLPPSTADAILNFGHTVDMGTDGSTVVTSEETRQRPSLVRYSGAGMLGDKATPNIATLFCTLVTKHLGVEKSTLEGRWH